jgi:hypothetical protein
MVGKLHEGGNSLKFNLELSRMFLKIITSFPRPLTCFPAMLMLVLKVRFTSRIIIIIVITTTTTTTWDACIISAFLLDQSN